MDYGGIHDMSFDKQAGSLLLPGIDVGIWTETIFRNLLAYEACYKSGSSELLEMSSDEDQKVVTRFILFMSHLVETEKDADALREEKIIQNNLGDSKEVARMWNDMNSSRWIPKCNQFDEITRELKGTLRILEEGRRDYSEREWVKDDEECAPDFAATNSIGQYTMNPTKEEASSKKIVSGIVEPNWGGPLKEGDSDIEPPIAPISPTWGLHQSSHKNDKVKKEENLHQTDESDRKLVMVIEEAKETNKEKLGSIVERYDTEIWDMVAKQLLPRLPCLLFLFEVFKAMLDAL
ncbi:hypothetical protein SUGI_0705230 [Cryptomeria japonica]|nr:hypothetical protein SUGI_0705230 [Cryptomeria japonica]